MVIFLPYFLIKITVGIKPLCDYTLKAGPKMKCPSSCPLNFDEFPFFKTSVARLEPEIGQFEVRSTFVEFFAICLVAQGDRQLGNDDEGAFV